MRKLLFVSFLLFILPVASAIGAYHHGEDTDSDIVLDVYPAIEGTKLDSCALCHSGGEYEKKAGVFVSMGSCQWCHSSFGYDESGDINSTMNEYELDYQTQEKSREAIAAIE